MIRRLIPCVAFVIVLANAVPAYADLTAFLAVSTTPETRVGRGFAFGFGLLVIGFEFEYASLSEDDAEGAPSLRTGAGNVLVQTPIDIAGISLYGTVGAGAYRERLLSRQETNLSTNLGGGAKIRLVGPLRVRLDYRVLKLAGDPLHGVYQRFYAGANLGF